MLTEPEIRKLLAVVMAYDNRRPSDATILAWSEAARRGRWTFEAALDAIHEHYATRTDWLMPGHITERTRAKHREPPPVHEVVPIAPAVQEAITAAGIGLEPARAFEPITPAFSRWRTRRSRRPKLEGELREQIEAELAEKRATGDAGERADS